MASGKSNFLAKKIADVMYGAVAYTTVTPVYFALWTAALSVTSTGATAGEASYTGYARVSVTNNATNFPAASGAGTASKANGGTAITWPQNTATANTVISAAICDASTAGNMMHWGDITSTVINVLDTPQIAISGFALTES